MKVLGLGHQLTPQPAFCSAPMHSGLDKAWQNGEADLSVSLAGATTGSPLGTWVSSPMKEGQQPCPPYGLDAVSIS